MTNKNRRNHMGSRGQRIIRKDNHNAVYPKRTWKSTQAGEKITASPFTTVYGIDRATHNELHRVCPEVPLPPEYILQVIASNVSHQEAIQMKYRQRLPIYENIYRFSSILEKISKGETPKNDIDRQVTALAAEAIMRQVEYLKHANIR